jgi:hypothetical protein
VKEVTISIATSQITQSVNPIKTGMYKLVIYAPLTQLELAPPIQLALYCKPQYFCELILRIFVNAVSNACKL